MMPIWLTRHLELQPWHISVVPTSRFFFFSLLNSTAMSENYPNDSFSPRTSYGERWCCLDHISRMGLCAISRNVAMCYAHTMCYKWLYQLTSGFSSISVKTLSFPSWVVRDSHLGGVQRKAAPPRWKESAEVVWAFDLDAAWISNSEVFGGCPSERRPITHWQDYVASLVTSWHLHEGARVSPWRGTSGFSSWISFLHYKGMDEQ